MDPTASPRRTNGTPHQRRAVKRALQRAGATPSSAKQNGSSNGHAHGRNRAAAGMAVVPGLTTVWSGVETVVITLRSWFCTVVATAVCWIVLAPTVKAFRERQKRARERGERLILAVQKHRTKFLDNYFTYGSFFGEEDFYLVLLPTLFWNWDKDLARGMTLIVCVGIASGNLLKDLFRVPRPRSPPVWVPKRVSDTDSTALRDFGFPSTHSCNGITNPGFMILYYWRAGVLSLEEPTFLILILAAGIIWCGSLCIGRLYLGVHSPSDVQGGFVIGAFLLGIAYQWGDDIDGWVLAGNSVWLPTILCSVLFMILHPQVRPRNPTYIQDCLLAGLITGCILGCRLLAQRVWLPEVVSALAPYALAPSWSHFAGPATPFVGALIRTVLGLTVVFLMRSIVKTVMAAFSSAVFGVKLGRRPADAGMESVDLHVALEAVSKYVCYAVLAWAITHAVPLVLEGFNLDVF